jgi:hypothetical protein
MNTNNLSQVEIDRLNNAIQAVIDTKNSSEPDGTEWRIGVALDDLRRIISGKIIAATPKTEDDKAFSALFGNNN